MTYVQPPLEFIPPAYNPLVRGIVGLLLPLWLHWQSQIVEIEVENGALLVDLYQQFQAGKIRFLLAFRHPSTNDPLCMGHLLWQHIPQVAKQKGVALNFPHAHFIYDRGIPLWAGKGVGWLYSRLGGTPIRRGKVDLMGLRSARYLFMDGQFPMAAAPEGATNGHNEIVSPIEPGIAQFGFWCVEDLVKSGRSERVLIVPIGIQYHYVDEPWQVLEQLLQQLEIDSGLARDGHLDSDTREAKPLAAEASAHGDITSNQQTVLYNRLYKLGKHLLILMEQFYTKFYHQTPSVALPQHSSLDPTPDPGAANEQLANHLQALLNAALNVTEQHFGLPAKGNLSDRCRRIEQAGWDRIYREDLKQLEILSPVERGLADRVAEEAHLRLWHMRLVETFVSVTGHYVLEKPTFDRYAETLLLLWDMVTRIKGKLPFPRPQLGQQRVQMTVGAPIVVSDRWDSYQSNRRQSVAKLTQDLQIALEEMIR